VLIHEIDDIASDTTFGGRALIMERMLVVYQIGADAIKHQFD